MTENISFTLAFTAGLLSFLSPCILPLIPAYLSYLTGTALNDMTQGKPKAALMMKAIGFVLGFSIIFIAMGATASKLGELFAEYQYTLRKIGGVLIIIMGIHLTGLIKLKALYQEKRFISFSKVNWRFSSVFIGMAFAAGWTPCIGPILASILIYAGGMETVTGGIVLLAFYSLGLAVPFLLTALALESFAKFIRKFSKYLPAVSIVSGILLILTGILVFTNKLAYLANILYFIDY